MKDLLKRLSPVAKHQELPYSLPPAADLPFRFETGSGIAVPNRSLFIEQLFYSCRQQLKLLQEALDLTTVILLWPGPAAGQLSPYVWVTNTEQLVTTPIPNGTGITGVLKEQRQVFLAPLRTQSPAIPYYPPSADTGSFMAARLELTSFAENQAAGSVILCADRMSQDSWTQQERTVFSLAAEQLVTLIDQGREFYLCDRQRHAYLQAFEGVRALNSALGLESAFVAIVDAVRQIVLADFIAVSLVESERHRLSHIVGENADQLLGQSFPVDQGLVGKVLKYARTLPDKADYQGTSPILSHDHQFAEYRSLMIVPLVQEERPVTGALIVAARQPGVFSRTCREMLEMLAGQAAVKIELAQSHEQINRLATIDTLTGIANRRAYQRGFEAMLERADRRGGSLYLVLCDIDHFKRINDRFGHPFGDEVLRRVARLFERVIRSNDLAARTGGEEFAILLEDSDEQGAWKVAERLREMVEQLKLRFRGEIVPVAISLGIAAFPRDADSLEKLVSCADQALYRAKDEGRNRTVRWQDQG